MRRLAKRAVEEFERGAEAVLFFAPTGYGKTEAAPYAWRASKMPRAIHVAPMRTLVGAVYEKWRKHAPAVGLAAELVGQQQMGEVEGKSPYFLRKAVATTFDSYVYNLFKLPPAARGAVHAYYELARFAISTAFHIFDEAHLYGGDVGAGDVKMFSAFLAAFSAVARRRLPVFVITATMPPQVSATVQKVAESNYDRVSIIDFEEEGDPDFKTPSYKTTVVDDWREVKLDGGKRYLFVFNTVKRAVEAYVSIKRQVKNAVLIHGRFTAEDRRKLESKIYDADVVVATQVVEVGIDLDREDRPPVSVLVTDAAPITSLVQRAGRICRNRTDCVGEVYVVRGDGSGVYDPTIVEASLKVLREDFDWKRPKEAIEEVYRGREVGLDYGLYADLWKLDADAYLSFSEARSLVEKLCSIARDSLLVPTYVGTVDEKHVVPVSGNLLPKLERHIRGVVRNGKVEPYSGEISCEDLVLGTVGGVLLDKGAYSKELGLAA